MALAISSVVINRNKYCTGNFKTMAPIKAKGTPINQTVDKSILMAALVFPPDLSTPTIEILLYTLTTNVSPIIIIIDLAEL